MLVPQILPQRWWVVVFSVLFFGTIGAAVFGRGVFEAQGFFGVMRAAGIGALVGLALSALFVPLFLLHDNRLIVLRKRNPDGLVAQAVTDDQTIATLGRIADRPFLDVNVGRFFSAVFNSAGVSFWRGVREPELIVGLPWSVVTGVTLDDFYRPGGKNQPGYFRLRLEISQDGEPSTMRFGIERVSNVPFSGNFYSEADIVATIERIEIVRGGAVTRPQRPVRSNVSAGLVDGRSAWAAVRLFPVSPLTAVVAAQLVFAVWILALRFDWPTIVTIAALCLAAVLVGAIFIVGRIAIKATNREKAAGYTTLNGVHLSLEQRHPRSGVVIRSAGESALSKKEFAALLDQS
jgi:hypothetical protein